MTADLTWLPGAIARLADLWAPLAITLPIAVLIVAATWRALVGRRA